MSEEEVLREILELEKKLEKFPREERNRIKRIVEYTHDCTKYNTHWCCNRYFCGACYIGHVRIIHKDATPHLEKLLSGATITARFNEKNEEDIIRSPEIQATSKGRIKCCGKFRSQNRHLRHCEVHHPKETQEEILKYKEKPETQRVSSRTRVKVDPIKLLSREELRNLIKMIQESQRTGEYYE